MKILKVLVSIVFLALGAGAYEIPFDQLDSVGSEPTLSPHERQTIEREVCALTKSTIKAKERTGEFLKPTEYFAVLLQIREIENDYEGGTRAGICDMELKQKLEEYKIALLKEQRGKVFHDEMQSAVTVFKKNITPARPQLTTEDKYKFVLSFLSWLLRTYFFWSLLVALYALLFWKESGSSKKRVSLFVAIVDGFAWPFLLIQYLRSKVRTTFRALWFEAKIRSFQERALDPLSDRLRAEIAEFARSTTTLKTQRRRFAKAGLVARRGIILSLVLTTVVVPLVSAYTFVDATPTDGVECVIDVDVGDQVNSTDDLMSDGLSPPTFPPTRWRVVSAIVDLVEVVFSRLRDKLFIVPRFAV